MATPKPKYKGVKFTTPIGRFSYPALFTPRPKYQKPNEFEYTTELLFDGSTDIKPIELATDNAIAEVFGTNKALWPKNISRPLTDQSVLIEKAAEKGNVFEHLVAGHKFMRFKTNATNAKPIVVDYPDKNEIIDPTKIYGGAYGRVSTQMKVNIIEGTDPVTKKKVQTIYVTCYLQGAQFIKDGDSFGGRPNVSEMFEPVTFDDGAEADLLG